MCCVIAHVRSLIHWSSFVLKLNKVVDWFEVSDKNYRRTTVTTSVRIKSWQNRLIKSSGGKGLVFKDSYSVSTENKAYCKHWNYAKVQKSDTIFLRLLNHDINSKMQVKQVHLSINKLWNYIKLKLQLPFMQFLESESLSDFNRNLSGALTCAILETGISNS